MSTSVIVIKRYLTPCGPLLLGEYDNRLCLCDWINRKNRLQIDARITKSLCSKYDEQETELLSKIITLLNQYFEGKEIELNIPLLLVGTDFQKKVWNALMKIPYGETVSYSNLAHKLGCPKSIRAVANAIGANPLSIVVPCHRIIGANGHLTGYAGGLEAKKFLLDLEKR